MLTGFYTYTGKEEYNTDFTQHQVSAHGGVRHKMHFVTKTSDKDCHYQRTTCKTSLNRCRHTRECDGEDSQQDS